MKKHRDTTLILSPDYLQLIEDLKARVVSARVTAAQAITHEAILLYWDISSFSTTRNAPPMTSPPSESSSARRRTTWKSNMPCERRPIPSASPPTDSKHHALHFRVSAFKISAFTPSLPTAKQLAAIVRVEMEAGK